MRQKTGEQLELALESRGETPHGQRSGEAPTTPHGDDGSGGDHRLMERVVERANALAALKRVKQNKGGPGVDGMTVGELSPYLVQHWEAIREQLLADTYQPDPVRRHDIPKPGGGTRTLGIPTVRDRLIQQCLLQVLTPLFDPTFSEHSYGFRPGRSAHDAVRAAQGYIQSGRRWVADVDLAKFFDRVNHDVLMERLSRKIADGRVLGLIRRYLVAGVMADGVVVERHDGTPQGGPLSPLLANVLLDEVDKELEKRGLKFARYADDLNVYAGSKRAANDAMATLKRLFARLRLQVNESKSAVARAWERKFLGYSFWVAVGRVVRPRVAPAALAEMKARVRVITSRTGGRNMESVAQDLRSYLVGWKNYFRLAATPRGFSDLDEWIRRRLRTVAHKQTGSSRCWWRAARSGAVHSALPNSHFDRLGVPRLAGR
jgi:group II intron reverse transcriptase/maturase